MDVKARNKRMDEIMVKLMSQRQGQEGKIPHMIVQAAGTTLPSYSCSPTHIKPNPAITPTACSFLAVRRTWPAAPQQGATATPSIKLSYSTPCSQLSQRPGTARKELAAAALLLIAWPGSLACLQSAGPPPAAQPALMCRPAHRNSSSSSSNTSLLTAWLGSLACWQ